MLRFDSIIDFIDVLHKEKKTLDFLFEKRKKNVTTDEVLSLMDYKEDRFNALIQQEILMQREKTVELSHVLKRCFEAVIQIIEEINNEYAKGLLKNLKIKMELVIASKKLEDKNKYIKDIVNTLDIVGDNLLRNINQIRKNIEDVYSTAEENKIRKIKLKDYDTKTKEIDVLMKVITDLLKGNQWESFLKIAENNDLEYATINLLKTLNKIRQNSIDIGHKLIVFHNKLKIQAAIYKKMQKIKQLKDKYLLKSNTNFEQVLNQDGALFFSPQQRYQYRLSILFLQTDKGLDLIFKTDKKYRKKKVAIPESPVTEIVGTALIQKEKQVQIFGLSYLKKMFVAANAKDLLDFLLDFDFQEDVSFEEKMTLFCKIASRYSNDLQHTGKYKIVDNVEYAIIASKK